MVEKLDINNEVSFSKHFPSLLYLPNAFIPQIILMKKTMQRSKVCVISKLVKKLRDVKKKLEKEPNTLKLSGRSVKLTEQIEYLKRTPNVELASLCLTSTKIPQQILTNPLSYTADLALANLCSYKVVDEKIKAIKDKYNLNDETVQWRKMLGEIGKKKQRKIIKEGHVKRKEAAKKVKDIQKRRDEWLEENIEGLEIVPKVMADGDDESEPEVNDDSDEDKLKDVPKKISATKLTLKKETPTKKRPMETKDKSTPILSKHIKVAKAPPPLKLDSFFVTASGTSYMAAGVTERSQPAGPNDGLDRRERRAQKFGRSSARRPERPQLQQQRNTSMRPQQTFQKSAANAPEAGLHPSWAAKQKTKGIDQFQGKKIKFGETAPAPSSIVRKAPQSIASTASEETAKLHPSWLAKQKQKPVISEFKGKKITFDD